MNKQYIIFDPINNVYWKKNRHYGYGWDNKAVLEATFTDKQEEATVVSATEAALILIDFDQTSFILGGYFKTVDFSSLEIRKANEQDT